MVQWQEVSQTLAKQKLAGRRDRGQEGFEALWICQSLCQSESHLSLLVWQAAEHEGSNAPTLPPPHLLSASDFLILGLPLKQRVLTAPHGGDTRRGKAQVPNWFGGVGVGVFAVTPISSAFSPTVRASGDNTT